MGEFAPCLSRSYSQPSPTSQESNEGDSLFRALTASVSFGRFISDSLAWEKWSSFSHNRHLEEVEKYSKPGSVAEKKAYFDAHYKKKAAERAAAAVEQQNAAVSDFPASSLAVKVENDSQIDIELAQEGSFVAIDERQGGDAPSTELIFSIHVNGHSPFEESKTEIARTEQTEDANEEPSFTGKQVESSILLEDAQQISDSQEEKAPIEDAATVGVSAFSDEKKPTLSSAKSSGHKQRSRPRKPVNPTTPIQSKNGEHVSSHSKTGRTFVDKKRPTPRSLHVSINFSSHTGDTNKNSSPVFQKIVNSRLIRNLNKTSRESTNPQTPIRAPVNGVPKHLSITPQPESRRTKTQLDHSVSERFTWDRELESPNKHSSKPSTICGRKAQCPIVSYSLQSGERAAKRKEFFQKLEHNVNMKEAKTEQLQEKLKGKTHNDSRDVIQHVASQAKANAGFHLGRTSFDVLTKKVSTTQPCLTRIKKQASEVLNNKSRPPWRLSMKMDSFKDVLGKNYRPPAYSTKMFPKRSMHENASPNIQL